MEREYQNRSLLTATCLLLLPCLHSFNSFCLCLRLVQVCKVVAAKNKFNTPSVNREEKPTTETFTWYFSCTDCPETESLHLVFWLLRLYSGPSSTRHPEIPDVASQHHAWKDSLITTLVLNTRERKTSAAVALNIWCHVCDGNMSIRLEDWPGWPPRLRVLGCLVFPHSSLLHASPIS